MITSVSWPLTTACTRRTRHEFRTWWPFLAKGTSKLTQIWVRSTLVIAFPTLIMSQSTPAKSRWSPSWICESKSSYQMSPNRLRSARISAQASRIWLNSKSAKWATHQARKTLLVLEMKQVSKAALMSTHRRIRTIIRVTTCPCSTDRSMVVWLNSKRKRETSVSRTSMIIRMPSTQIACWTSIKSKKKTLMKCNCTISSWRTNSNSEIGLYGRRSQNRTSVSRTLWRELIGLPCLTCMELRDLQNIRKSAQICFKRSQSSIEWTCTWWANMMVLRSRMDTTVSWRNDQGLIWWL